MADMPIQCQALRLPETRHGTFRTASIEGDGSVSLSTVSFGCEARPSKAPFDQLSAIGRTFDLVVPEFVCPPVAFVESGHALAPPRPVNAYHLRTGMHRMFRMNGENHSMLILYILSIPV